MVTIIIIRRIIIELTYMEEIFVKTCEWLKAFYTGHRELLGDQLTYPSKEHMRQEAHKP